MDNSRQVEISNRISLPDSYAAGDKEALENALSSYMLLAGDRMFS